MSEATGMEAFTIHRLLQFEAYLGDFKHNENNQLDPISIETISPGFRINGNSAPLRSIDSLVKNNQIFKIDYLKLDVEGSELAALKGADMAIKKFRPKLAISLYHNPNDLFEIPLYIKNQYPFYDFYLDHYTIHYDETVLYCMPKSPDGVLKKIKRRLTRWLA
jgi:hypothetical protein